MSSDIRFRRTRTSAATRSGWDAKNRRRLTTRGCWRKRSCRRKKTCWNKDSPTGPREISTSLSRPTRSTDVTTLRASQKKWRAKLPRRWERDCVNRHLFSPPSGLCVLLVLISLFFKIILMITSWPLISGSTRPIFSPNDIFDLRSGGQNFRRGERILIFAYKLTSRWKMLSYICW